MKSLGVGCLKTVYVAVGKVITCVKEFATLEFKKACALTLLLTVEPNCENNVTVFVTTAGLTIAVDPVLIAGANSVLLPGNIFILKVSDVSAKGNSISFS